MRLTVAGDARHADNLVGAHGEVDGVEQRRAGRIVERDAFEAQHFVAGLVAVKVVDLFEIVEIDSNCRQRLFAALEIVEQVAQRGGETAAVMAAGQMVEIGQTARFFLGCAAGVQFVGQCLVALPAEQDQRDIEQQGIG